MSTGTGDNDIFQSALAQQQTDEKLRRAAQDVTQSEPPEEGSEGGGVAGEVNEPRNVVFESGDPAPRLSQPDSASLGDADAERNFMQELSTDTAEATAKNRESDKDDVAPQFTPGTAEPIREEIGGTGAEEFLTLKQIEHQIDLEDALEADKSAELREGDPNSQ